MLDSMHSLQAVAAERQAELITAAEHYRLRRLVRAPSRASASRPSHRRWRAYLGRRPAVAR